MDAVKFLEEEQRATKGCGLMCRNCPKGRENNGLDKICFALSFEERVAIIEKWSAEHPQKTYAMDFFEKFPNAPKQDEAKPKPCRKDIYGGDCPHACADCWDEAMEETK